MSYRFSSCWVAVALLATPCLQAGGISTTYDDIFAFTDFTINGIFNQEPARQLFEKHLDAFWVDRLQKQLPEDASLELTFHDIDMAGEMRPVPRFGQAHSRIIADSFPPSLRFSYRILDASGSILAEGDESLLGKDFQFRFRKGSMAGRMTFFYEFEMLSSWLKVVSLAGKGELANGR